MRRTLLLAAIPLLLLPSGAARAAESGPEDSGPPHQVASGGPQRYETAGTVLESPRHGPELCFIVAESYPPQCGGIPLANWRWEGLPGVQSVRGTTWGVFHLVGTYDGTTFSVEEAEEPLPAPEPVPPEPLAATPCPEPPGGWTAGHPVQPGPQELEAANQVAYRQPDFAGLWVDYVAEAPGPFVLNVAFTGNLDRHRKELRAVWDGPLCVSHHPRTYRELRQIAADLSGPFGRELGLDVLGAGVWVISNQVRLDVVVLDDHARAAIDRRFGKGVVRAHAELRPVE